MQTRSASEQMSPRLKARIAGLLYLLIILGGLLAPFAIAPSGMMLGEPALPDTARILASKPLYVLGGAVQLFVYACDVGVAILFYELLKPVGRTIALLASCFRLVFVAVASANMFNHFAPLVLLSGADYLRGFDPGQLQALAVIFLRLRTFGFDIALFFFGIHWVLAGYLFFRSTFFPRLLGAALILAGIGYLADVSATAMPHKAAAYLFPYIMLPAGLAEIALTLWLLIVGINLQRWQESAACSDYPES